MTPVASSGAAACGARSFDDEILNGGVLPLDLLDARMSEWIRDQKQHAKPATS